MELIDLSKISSLTETETQILNSILYSLQNGEKINIRTIARKSFVSTTTVVNLSKKLGFETYSEMMYTFKRKIVDDKTSENYELESKFFTNIESTNINHFVSLLKKYKKNRIYIVSIGFSNIATSYLNKKLSALGFYTYDGSPLDMYIYKDEPIFVIFISKTGETRDLIDIMKRINSFDCESVLFTTDINSTLASKVNLVFDLHEPITPLKGSPDFFVGKVIILTEILLSKYYDYLIR